jgi:hypothetical protein
MPIHNIGKVLVLKFRTPVSTVVLWMNIIFACVFNEMHIYRNGVDHTSRKLYLLLSAIVVGVGCELTS